jgi:hypothetical protein
VDRRHRSADPDLPLLANYGPDLARTHVPIGQGLADADVPANMRTVAVNDAGAIPYYSRWNTIDFIGLNDEQLAHGADVTERVVDAYGLDVPRAAEGYDHVGNVQMREGYHE